MKTVVIYHANCPDGFCSAWLLHKVYPEAEFVPAHYGNSPPDVEGARVFIVDFSYPQDVLHEIWNACASFVLIDHHKSAEPILNEFLGECLQSDRAKPTVIFNNNKSGAHLTWGYLTQNKIGNFAFPSTNIHGPNVRGQEPNADDPPWLVAYTEDRDLWKFELPDSKAVSAALRSLPFDFEKWDSISLKGHLPLVSDGEAILRYQEIVIQDHVRNAVEIRMDGYNVLCVNATTLFSEIAGRLAEGRPFGVCYFDRQDGKRQYSLRSRDGGVDVSEIAKSHGGGGHRNAAGFEIDPAAEFEHLT